MIKLYDLINVLGSELVEIAIPADSELCEKRWFCGPADELLGNENLPMDVEVDEVVSSTSYSITCKPHSFPEEGNGTKKFEVVFSSEEARIIDQIADGWFLEPHEVVSKIVNEYLKRIEEEIENE